MYKKNEFIKRFQSWYVCCDIKKINNEHIQDHVSLAAATTDYCLGKYGVVGPTTCSQKNSLY